MHQLDIEELEANNYSILQKSAENVIHLGKSYHFAIDITLDPYYGKRTGKYENYIIGDKRKASTSYFYGYASLYVSEPNRHVSLGVVPITKTTRVLGVVTTFIDKIRELGLGIKSLCLDREFYVADIFNFLQREEIPHIIPAKMQSSEMKKQVRGRKSKSFTYELNSGKENAVMLNVVDCVLYLNGKKDKHGIEHHAFVIYGLCTVPHHVRSRYKRRFGIETSYRMRNTIKPKTTTKDPVIRYFYALVSFVLQNIWIATKWRTFKKKQPGPAVIDDKKLSLKHFAKQIQKHAFEKWPLIEVT